MRGQERKPDLIALRDSGFGDQFRRANGNGLICVERGAGERVAGDAADGLDVARLKVDLPHDFNFTWRTRRQMVVIEFVYGLSELHRGFITATHDVLRIAQ